MTHDLHDHFASLAQWIARFHRPLLVTHAKPDGDALGSLVAMRALLSQGGADPLALLYEPLPETYQVFARFDSLPVLGKSVNATVLSEVDAVVVLDTCTYTQLEPIADWLRQASCPKLAVDHHVNRDELADRYLVDESASATCLILKEWARAACWPINAVARDALLIGIATDTGWFRHSNTDARTFAAAAELTEAGAGIYRLHQELFQQDSIARLQLLSAALNSLEWLAGGRIAVMRLTSDDFRRSGAVGADTENIVNEPLRVRSAAVSVILVDQGNGPIRVSFRSKPPLIPSDPDIDVSEIAHALGGGGHRRAAATRITGRLDEVYRTVVNRLTEAVS